MSLVARCVVAVKDRRVDAGPSRPPRRSRAARARRASVRLRAVERRCGGSSRPAASASRSRCSVPSRAICVSVMLSTSTSTSCVLQRVEERVGVGDDAVGEVGDRRFAAPVARVGVELERRAVIPAREHVRSARERLVVERRVVDVGQAGQQVRRAAADSRRRRARRCRGSRRRARAGARSPYRCRAASMRGDVVPARAQARVVARVHHRLPGEAQIARVERRAVGPPHARGADAARSSCRRG